MIDMTSNPLSFQEIAKDVAATLRRSGEAAAMVSCAEYETKLAYSGIELFRRAQKIASRAKAGAA
jgi:hypothetical protein